MNKKIIISENQLISLLKTVTESVEVDNKKLKDIIIAFKYLDKKFSGKYITRKEYQDILSKLNFKELVDDTEMFDLFNRNSGTNANWAQLYKEYLEKIDGLKKILIALSNFDPDITELKINGDGSSDHDDGFNRDEIEVEISFKYKNKKYYTLITVEASYYYNSVDDGDYYTPSGDDYIDDEDITIIDDKIFINDEDDNEYPIWLGELGTFKRDMESLLFQYYDAYDNKIKK